MKILHLFIGLLLLSQLVMAQNITTTDSLDSLLAELNASTNQLMQSTQSLEKATREFASTPHSISDFPNCVKVDNYTMNCFSPLMFFETPVEFTSDVYCYSSQVNKTCSSDCASMIYGGCSSQLKLIQPTETQLCYDIVSSKKNSIDKQCDNLTYPSKSTYAIVMEDMIQDYSSCSKKIVTASSGNKYWEIVCPFKGKKMLVSGAVLPDSGAFYVQEIINNSYSNQLTLKNVFLALFVIIFAWALLPYFNKKEQPIMPKSNRTRQNRRR